MSEFKGTKGNWEVEKAEIDSSGRGLYRVRSYNVPSYDELKANAQLISKSPEMLDLLNHFVNADPNDGSWDYQACISKARQLIKESTI